MGHFEDNFIFLIIELSEYFDQYKKSISFDLTIHKNNIEEFKDLVKNKTNLKTGKWIIDDYSTVLNFDRETYRKINIMSNEDIELNKEKLKNHIIIY